MAAQLGLGRHWFHKDHYDLPVNRRVEIEQIALHVNRRVVVRLIKRRKHRMATELPLGTESENIDMEEIMYHRMIKEGKTGVHYCPEWDFMAIHDQSPEFDACLCDLSNVK